jgi:hypothetical protein
LQKTAAVYAALELAAYVLLSPEKGVIRLALECRFRE